MIDISKWTLVVAVCLGLVTGADARAEAHEADVVVYGDASGGVTAAVQAARMGKSVILVSQYGHLGGMTSSGLGWTDIGNDRILGGLSREFYHRLYLHYQKPAAWTRQERDAYSGKGQGVPALNDKTQLASTFEPKVAEAVFDAMAKEAGAKVIDGRLDLQDGVVKSGKRITAIRLEGGTTIKGKVFIDASYECDLLPGAGVSFVMGRESNAEFNERGNGNTGVARKNVSATGSFRVFAAEDLSYHTYNTTLSELRRLEKAHPKTGKLHDLGVSSDGRTRVWAFKISDDVEKEEDEPNVLLTGGIHGNERASSEMALFTIRRLLSEDFHRALIDKTQIWVIPILNPAGHETNSHNNAKRVDLNRNFPADWTSDDLDGVQIEIQNLVKNFHLRRDHVVAGIDLHTYGRAYLLPWAHTHKKPADWDALKDLADKMAKTSGYRVLQLTEYLRRTVPGGGADYRYGRYGSFYYGLELGTSHAPSAEQLGRLCRKNLPGIMIMMNRVHTSTLTGHVTRNGKPAAAVVDVDGIDKPANLRRPYMSDATFGRYYRILLPGTYTVRFTFDGKKMVKENVIIVDDRQTVLDIEFL